MNSGLSLIVPWAGFLISKWKLSEGRVVSSAGVKTSLSDSMVDAPWVLLSMILRMTDDRDANVQSSCLSAKPQGSVHLWSR